jgi:hypothetical protein
LTVSPSAGVGSEPGDIRTISYQRETTFMAHPIIEEFCRIHTPDRMQTVFFRRMQRVLRDEIAPMLDERERLLVEVDELGSKNTGLQVALREAQIAASFKAEVNTTEAKPTRKPKAEPVTA